MTIDDLTNLGEGVGRIDGWVIMVPFALPGERVIVRIWRNKKNYSDGDLVAVLEASPDRVEPQCPLFQECGGCQYQHLSYAAQLHSKTNQIVELMRRLAELQNVSVEPCIGSPEIYGYRSKLTPHFDSPRDGVIGAIGFQRYANRSILDVPQCPIARPAINQAMGAERERIRTEKRPGKTKKRGGTLLLREGLEGVTTDNKELLSERVGGRVFQFIAGEFFQNNPFILPIMVDYALGQAKAAGIQHFVDAYCGVGVFGICGASRFESVTGIEVNAPAIALAQANAKINGIRNTEFLIGAAESIFEGLSLPPESTAILMDPPRKGADEVFLRQLVEFGPARVVYVSCGPDTQARDLKYLCAHGYEVTRIQPFDLFPQTRHIENVVTLVRGAEPGE